MIPFTQCKHETYFAECSKVKTPDNQNFSDFAEHIWSLEGIVMESLIPNQSIVEVQCQQIHYQ